MPFFSYSIINSQCHLHENATRPSDIYRICCLCFLVLCTALFVHLKPYWNYQMYIREIEIDSGVVVMVKTGY